MRKLITAGCGLLLVVLTACGASETQTTLTLIAHDSFVGGATDQTFAAFTQDTGIEVELLTAGDAGSMVNQAILTKTAPLADILFGLDNTLLSRGLEEDLFLPYKPELQDSIDPDLLAPTEGKVTPIDFGDVCINYDIDALAKRGLPIPKSLEELRDPAWNDALVVQNPATSSPGLAFLLATFGTFGENGWEQFWQDLVNNGVKVEPGWDAAYYGSFTRYGGDRPLVVSYASSPPAEVIFSDPSPATAPTGVLTDGCYRQVEYAGILSGTPYPTAAGQLLDFMLSTDFQDLVPLSWFVYPVNPQATLPSEFMEHTTLPDDPINLDPALVDRHRADLIEDWTRIVFP